MVLHKAMIAQVFDRTIPRLRMILCWVSHPLPERWQIVNDDAMRPHKVYEFHTFSVIL
jgi:hypothetical protein